LKYKVFKKKKISTLECKKCGREQLKEESGQHYLSDGFEGQLSLSSPKKKS